MPVLGSILLTLLASSGSASECSPARARWLVSGSFDPEQIRQGEWLDAIPSDSPEWKAWMSRQTDGRRPEDGVAGMPVSNPNYFRDAHAALREWISARTKGGLRSFKGFAKALQDTHKRVAKGYEVVENFFEKTTASPGIFRDAIERTGDRVGVDIYVSPGPRSKETSDLPMFQIERMAKKWTKKNARSPGAGKDASEQVTLFLEFQGERYAVDTKLSRSGDFSFFYWDTELSTFDPPKRLQNGNNDHGAPPFQELRSYLENGHQTYLRFLENLQDKNPEAALEALADYYHVMINAHPFRAVNNSILMSQVNEGLALVGKNPVVHGYMDYWANSLSTKEFRRFFKNYASNPKNEAFRLFR